MKLRLIALSIWIAAFGLPQFLLSQQASPIVLGSEQTSEYLPLLRNKRVGLLINHTSRIGQTHLVDTLLSLGVQITTLFSPEHGIRGNADAGEKVDHSKDPNTGLPVISLYGKNKKPTVDQMASVDIVVFDIQDVGVRFYTYISTLHYMMEACAESHVPIVVLDRPNPNGDYIDGPVLEPAFRSFVGMHPIPVVHGLTVGELARMILGEGWLNTKSPCNLKVIALKNYTHRTPYAPPVPPSPNLPNLKAIRLYPSLCWFEGTDISVGRGTSFPFQAIGYPDAGMGHFRFQPKSLSGMSKNPPHLNQTCYGLDLRAEGNTHRLTLKYLLEFYQLYPHKEKFFTQAKFFDLLAGTNQLRIMIENGKSEPEIKNSWKKGIETYLLKRKPYLLYP